MQQLERVEMSKTSSKKISGVYAFLPTPTKDDGEQIDEGRLRSFIDYQIAQGVDGITIFGSTGGIGSFTEEERKLVTRVAAEQINGQLPLIVGTGSMKTSESIRLSQYAEEVGATGVLVVPITYWPLTDDEVYEHCAKIANAIRIPMGVYNNPGTTGIDIKPLLMAKLFEIDNIQFCKEISGDLSRQVWIRQLTEGKMAIFHGWDSIAPQAFAGDLDGWFAGTASIAPKLCLEVFHGAKNGKNLIELQHQFDRLFRVCEFMGKKGYLRVVHEALDILGRLMGVPRSPLRSLSSSERQELEGILKYAELL